MNKYIIFILLIITKLIGTTCCDGTYSSSTGRGTCSHHGGVCNGGGGYTPIEPSVPNGLSISCINNQNITLNWNNASNTSFYEIYYSPSCDYSYSYLDNSYSSSYTTSSLGTCNICFKIKSCSYSSCSSYSGSIQGKNETVFSYSASELNSVEGDIIKLNNRTCRLYGIDIPEIYYSSQLYNDAEMCQIDEDIIKQSGEEAKTFIENIIKNQNLEIQIMGKDNVNRDICNIKLNENSNLNELLIQEGYAIVWEKYIESKDLLDKYKEYEENAKNNLKGLWSSSYNVMSCLSDKKSIFDNNTEFSFHDIVISSYTLENGYKELNFNYQNSGDNKFIVKNNSNFELNENSINISDITNNIHIYLDGQITITNNSSSSIVSHEFNSSIDNSDILEYSQMIDKNTVKYYINNIFQFSINYFQNSLMSIKHKDSSKFKNDMNITTNSKVWIDNKSNTKSLFITTTTSNSIKF